MKLTYIQAESNNKPPVIEMGKRTVWIRKDFVRTETGWTYKEAKLSPSEFDTYISELKAQNAINGIADSDNIEQIMDGQVTVDMNQLTIMEAIADLYSVQETTETNQLILMEAIADLYNEIASLASKEDI